ncbi:MAG: Wzt carbohydrate-binding domain-containing protein, partial [Acidimicrobiales bacterium]
FSVAIHTEPEVLLVDEVLAVGDLAFQLKCYKKMRQLQTSGTTVVMVSHSMHAIRNLCPRAVLMDRGHIVFDGEVEKAIVRNHELITRDATERAATSGPTPSGDHEQTIDGGVTIVSRHIEGPVEELPRGSSWPLTYCARLRFDAEVRDPCLNFQVFAEDGTLAFSTFSAINHQWRTFEAGEESVVRIAFTPRLSGGTYRLSLAVMSSDLRALLANDTDGILLYVPTRIGSAGIAELNATVRIDGSVINDPDVMGLGLVAPDRVEGAQAVEDESDRLRSGSLSTAGSVPPTQPDMGMGLDQFA